MKPIFVRRRPVIAACLAIVSGLILLAGNASAAVRIERGEEQIVAGRTVYSWAAFSGDEVVEAGVTLPLELIEHPPAEPGAGPAGAISVLAFPAKVRETTFLNHFELNWEKGGHEPPVFMTPHFDFHFYSIPVEAVMAIAPPDPSPPKAELLPAGYIYPGAEFTVPQMGVHALKPADLERPFSDVLIFGFYGGQMIFIEPMVTQAKLLERQAVRYAIPVPTAVATATRIPTQFRLEYDQAGNACHLRFTDFVTVTP